MKHFLLFLIVNVLVHLPFINKPPCGAHVWRQCNTLSMAQNFATEGMNIFEPKIDRRDGTDGITGSHFPLYEWLLAWLYKVFGFSNIVARLFSLFIFTAAMYAFSLALLKLNFSKIYSLVGGFLLLSIPEFYYHAINAMPDILALAFVLGALYFWLQYAGNNNLRYCTIAFVLTMLGALIKFQFIVIPFVAVVFFIKNRKQWLPFVLAWGIAVAVVIAWYAYAIKLTNTSNLREYGLWIKPITLQEKLQIFWKNLAIDLPEMLLGWPLFIAFAVALYLGKKQPKAKPLFYLIILWAASFLIFYIVAIERMQHHTYYLMVLLPLFIVFILNILNAKNIKPWLLYTLVGLNFAWAMVRIIPSRWVASKAQVPVEFLDKKLLNEFKNVIPAGQQVLIGPDISGCIYFYFTGTKGFSFETPEELFKVHNNEVKLNAIKQQNVHYIIFNKTETIQPYFEKLGLKRKLKHVGSFEIWAF